MLRDFVLKSGITGALVLLAGAGCVKSNSSQPDLASGSSPIVTQVETRTVASPGEAPLRMAELKKRRAARGMKSKLHAAFTSVESPIVASQVTFDKASILNQTFLYGSDLQYSSIDQGEGMLLQSIAIGHATARFQILGDRLQLLAEEKYKFESNINIPLRLIFEWPIVKQFGNQITIDVAAASAALGGVLGAEYPVRSSWVRSVEFVAQGNYLLIESSVELANGQVAEFMESIFPRSTLVASAPAPLFSDPALETLAERFGFLANAVWFDLPHGRTQTAVAQRFASPAAGKTIDWYVTPNIPTEFLPAVQAGVEGWNRYSQKMWGRDFVKFQGLLPKGIKIGDPRYNIINWDSVVDASSAYESQASDQETGIQSHSLIYLPYAWVKVGKEFWERGQLTQDQTAVVKNALDAMKFMGGKVRIPCFKEAAMSALSLRTKTDPDTFGKDLLRGTLFHEVGHALGLAHNFKGSLEWDPDATGTSFTSSIMDYNHYDLEDGAFDASGTASGPLLEYDRQIISALYNEGKDIAPDDRVVPYCDDEAADSKAGGVDPLCIRYDSGQDPSVMLVRTLNLIQDPSANIGRTKSLAKAASDLAATLGDPSVVASDQDIAMAESSFRLQISALSQYYASAGAQGLNYMLSANLRNLATFKSDTLPSTIDPSAFRDRIATTMDTVMDLEQFSSATRTAFEKIGDQTVAWLQTTEWYKTATPAARTEREASMRDAALESLQSIAKLVLPRVRTRQIGALVRTPSAPFFMSTQIDYELKALGWLEKVLTKRMPSGASYSIAERVAAAQTLASFKKLPLAISIQIAARTRTETDIMNASSAQERESLRALLGLLQ